MQTQVDLDGRGGSLVVEGMHSEDILQLQEVHVWAERHLPHAVGVKVELVVRNLHKMLKIKVLKQMFGTTGARSVSN